MAKSVKREPRKLYSKPALPVVFGKTPLQEAMARLSPERVGTQPKTAVQGDPVSARPRLTGFDLLDEMPLSMDLGRYTERLALMAPHVKMQVEMNEELLSMSLEPCCLLCLGSAPRVRYNLHAEADNG
jgi:hypothetical protein